MIIENTIMFCNFLGRLKLKEMLPYILLGYRVCMTYKLATAFTSSRYWATFLCNWNGVWVHLMNVSPIFNIGLYKLYRISLFICSMLHFLHQLISNILLSDIYCRAVGLSEIVLLWESTQLYCHCAAKENSCSSRSESQITTLPEKALSAL